MAPEDDPVKRLIEHAKGLLERSPSRADVHALADGMRALPDRELVRFDQSSRTWHMGLAPRAIKRLHRPHRPRA